MSARSKPHICRAVIALTGFLLPLLFTVVDAKDITIIRRLEGSFLTDTSGVSVTQPPYIQVIRSKDGFDYLMSRFDKMSNRVTKGRVEYLRKQMVSMDYNKHMLIGVFSQPMDNYKMTLEGVNMDSANRSIEVSIFYQHNEVGQGEAPAKSIYYIIAVAQRSENPVTLLATEVEGTKDTPTAKLLTVTGRVMPVESGTGLQLAPVVVRRQAKSSYFIRDESGMKMLERYIGMVVTLQGTVSRERDNLHQWELEVKKIVRVYQ